MAFQSQLGLHLPTFHSEQNCLKVDMGKVLKLQNFTQMSRARVQKVLTKSYTPLQWLVTERYKFLDKQSKPKCEHFGHVKIVTISIPLSRTEQSLTHFGHVKIVTISIPLSQTQQSLTHFGHIKIIAMPMPLSHTERALAIALSSEECTYHSNTIFPLPYEQIFKNRHTNLSFIKYISNGFTTLDTKLVPDKPQFIPF